MKLSFVHLHNVAFLEGTLKDKITADPKSNITLDLKWLNIDGKEELFLVIHRGQKKLNLPMSNVIGFIEATDTVAPVAFSAPIHKGKIKAQASTPQDHVFNGMGAGKTND